MLNEKIIEQLTERLVNRIEKGNTYVLKQIGHSIKKIGELSPSKAQALEQVLKYGGSYEKIVNKLAEITELNVKEIYKIFEELAKKDYQFAKQFYDYRGIDYIPWEQNKTLQNQVKAIAELTIGKHLNISRTTALGFGFKNENGKFVFKGLQQAYYDAIDEAILSVSQGKDTFQQQMLKTIKELGSSGLKVLYPTGYSRRLDSAVRMNIQGGLRDLHNEVQQQFGKEFGSDGIEISVHSNPAPDHEEAQGRQFSNEEYYALQGSGIAKDYTGKVIDITSISKMGNVSHRPISEMNCYHYIFSIVLGVSKPEYSDEQLQKIIDDNNKGFDFDGKHYTNYEGTQLQRTLETKIREQKDVQIIAKASGNDDLITQSQNKIEQLANKYRQLSDVSGLPTKIERIRVSGYKKVAIKK